MQWFVILLEFDLIVAVKKGSTHERYLLNVPLSHIFARAGYLKMLGMYLPHCIRQGMRLVLVISVNNWRVSI